MKKLIIITVTSVLLSACNIYKKYERPQVDTQDLYRTENQTKQNKQLTAQTLDKFLGKKCLLTAICKA